MSLFALSLLKTKCATKLYNNSFLLQTGPESKFVDWEKKFKITSVAFLKCCFVYSECRRHRIVDI